MAHPTEEMGEILLRMEIIQGAEKVLGPKLNLNLLDLYMIIVSA